MTKNSQGLQKQDEDPVDFNFLPARRPLVRALAR
jgi:hypothetical protein